MISTHFLSPRSSVTFTPPASPQAFQPKHQAHPDQLEVRFGATQAKDANGNTALRLAAQQGDLRTVKVLIAAQPKLNGRIQQTYNGSTALTLAAKNGHLKVLQALIAAEGEDFNAKDETGHTALMWAAQKGDAPAVKALIAFKGFQDISKVNLDVENNDGKTALDLATQNEHTQVAKLLQRSARKKSKLLTAATNENVGPTQRLGDFLKSIDWYGKSTPKS